VKKEEKVPKLVEFETDATFDNNPDDPAHHSFVIEKGVVDYHALMDAIRDELKRQKIEFFGCS